MENKEPKTKEISRVIYYEFCEICRRQITANSPSALKYVMNLHKDKHEREK